MKLLMKVALALTLIVMIADTAEAQRRGRKLPAKAYISSAKIEILGYGETKEQVRIETAIGMLDSLFMYYGPHTEGYFWYSQIQWDLSKEQSDLKKRLEHVKKAIVYADSLKWACGNKEINKKYRKGCEKTDEQMDSIKVAEWRDYYNAGVGQVDEISELIETVKVSTDSAELAYYQVRLDALKDSCQDNMALAIAIDSTDAKPFIGIASIYEKSGDYLTAVEYLKRALDKADDREQLLISIAYDYIQASDYAGATPWFKEYIDSMTSRDEVMQDPSNRASVISTIHNLAISYNNSQMYDSGFVTYQRILGFEPEDVEALAGVGRYYRQLGRDASDSARAAKDADDEAKNAEFMKQRNEMFDSAGVYLGKAFEVNPDDASLAAEYALMKAILQKFEEACIGFARAAELKPDVVDYWISLGDCELSLKKWPETAAAYEKVVELTPDNKAVWERLADLYQQIGDKERRAEIQAILKDM